MLAHLFLIITSGLSSRLSPGALDRAIRQLTWMKKTIVLVLGSDGDEVMRVCEQIEATEMVFDPNGTSDFSPVKAGLQATDAPAFIWHPDQPFPTSETFELLESILRNDVFPLADALRVEGDPSGLIVTTPRGAKRLKERPSASTWPSADDVVIRAVSKSDLPS